jgi:hypothetical protein
LFDGHAGTGAAVAAANQLHHILHVSTFHITALCITSLLVFSAINHNLIIL